MAKMMRKSTVWLCLAVWMAWANSGLLNAEGADPNSNPTRMAMEKILQKMEDELSVNGGLYFIVNLEEKKILLKCRGIFLKNWPIHSYLFWGEPIPFKPLPLLKRNTPKPPKRENIKPGDKDANLKLDVLEVGDMPLIYDLWFENNIQLEIKPKPEKVLSKLHYYWKMWDWYTSSPLTSIAASIKKEQFTRIRLWLDNKDAAQSMFWTLAENTPCIFILSNDLMTPPPPPLPPPAPLPKKKRK